jgi:hypothetical protein
MILGCRVWMRAVCGLVGVLVLAAAGGVAWAGDGETAPARDPKQAVDEAYTAKMKKYTTAPYFTSPLVDYLPASKNVPTPEVVLGDVAGAPGILPYAEDVYKYMRLLEKASPRVKVFSIGRRARDDRGGGVVGRKFETFGRKSGATDEISRSTNDPAE